MIIKLASKLFNKVHVGKYLLTNVSKSHKCIIINYNFIHKEKILDVDTYPKEPLGGSGSVGCRVLCCIKYTNKDSDNHKHLATTRNPNGCK